MLYNLIGNYQSLRRYRDVDQICDRLVQLGLDKPSLREQKAFTAFLEKADVNGYRAALEALPSSAKQDLWNTGARIRFAAFAHDWTAAKKIFSDSSNEELIFFFFARVPPGCVEIWLAMARGENPAMDGKFQATRDELKAKT